MTGRSFKNIIENNENYYLTPTNTVYMEVPQPALRRGASGRHFSSSSVPPKSTVSKLLRTPVSASCRWVSKLFT